MRVLHIGKFFPPFAGGIEHFMGDLLPALDRIGVKSLALVHDHRFGHRSATCGDAFSGVIRVPCYGTLLYAPLSPSFPWALKRAISRFAPDFLHLHLPNTSAFWALAVPGARRIPWVIHWHSDVVPSAVDKRLAGAYRFYRPLEQALLRRAGSIVATSPPYLATSTALASWLDKCVVVPLGIDPRRLPDATPQNRRWAESIWNRRAMRVLAVGRLTYYKGHDVLIRAAAENDGIHVVIVGEGERRRSNEALIRQLGVADRVSLTGKLEALRFYSLMDTCDCFCLPSIERTEAFGLVLLEAMRYGRVAVAADVPGSGIGWVIRHEQTGLLARMGDPGALATALRRLARSPEEKKRLGDAASQRFAAEFQIGRVAEKIRRVYLELRDGSSKLKAQS